MNDRDLLKIAGEELGVQAEQVPATVKKLLEETRELEEKIKAMR